mmetsp:Transcript_15810/g.18026  ORF Transcript_15810/g.18026 Transcript_15810/m.18026 type:complete len:358 (-) Transcript_15810:63-1136(-)
MQLITRSAAKLALASSRPTSRRITIIPSCGTLPPTSSHAVPLKPSTDALNTPKYLSTANNVNSSNSSNNSGSITSSILTSLYTFKSRHSIVSQQERALQASHLFQSLRHQAHNPKWYCSQNKIKPDFRQIHAMLSMHLWFVHRRLIAKNNSAHCTDIQKNDNLMLQEELFEIFWNDTRARIRAQGINELTVNKHMKDAQRATFVHCTQYDHAFTEYPDDVQKRFEIICDSVWRHVLGAEEDAEDDLIRRIGAYVEYQLDNVVYKLPDDYFKEGRVAWGDIPDLDWNTKTDDKLSETKDDQDDTKATVTSQTSDTDDNNDKSLSGMEFLENNWVQVLTDAGLPYYWNTESNQTTWKRP